MKHQQPLYPIFFEHEDSFKKLGKMWEAIRISKKNQIQDNLKIKLRGWREKNGLEELKEDYLQAVIMKKTSDDMALFCQQIKNNILLEQEQKNIWGKITKKLSDNDITQLEFLQKTGFKFKGMELEINQITNLTERDLQIQAQLRKRYNEKEDSR